MSVQLNESNPKFEFEEIGPTIQQLKQKEQIQQFKLEDIIITTSDLYPIALEIKKEIKYILDQGVIKMQMSIPKTQKLIEKLLSQEMVQTTKYLFWIVFVILFQKNKIDLLVLYRNDLSQSYSNLFSSLDYPKDKFITYIIFVTAYLVHSLIYRYFPELKNTATSKRFILDCYHIVTNELNGIFVSDNYICHHISKIFTNKFLVYEPNTNQDSTPFQKQDNLQTFFNITDNNNSNAERNITFIHAPGSLDLLDVMNSKLQKLKSKPKLKLEQDNSVFLSQFTKKQIVQSNTQQHQEPNLTHLKQQSTQLFDKMKFNCTQTSPAIFQVLGNNKIEQNFLQKGKIIKYAPTKSLTQINFLNKIKSRNNSEKNLNNQFDKSNKTSNNHSVKAEKLRKEVFNKYQVSKQEQNQIDEKYKEKFPEALEDKFKIFLDVNYVLSKHSQTFRPNLTLKQFEDNNSNTLKSSRNITNVQLPNLTNSIQNHNSDQNEIKDSLDQNTIQNEASDINKQFKDTILSKSILMSLSKKQNFLTINKIKSNFAEDLIDGKKFQNNESNSQIFEQNEFQFRQPINYKVFNFQEKHKFVEVTEQIPSQRTQWRQQMIQEPTKYYKDKRKMYSNQYVQFIPQNIDAKMDEIVYKLLSKKNHFTKNINKFKIEPKK